MPKEYSYRKTDEDSRDDLRELRQYIASHGPSYFGIYGLNGKGASDPGFIYGHAPGKMDRWAKRRTNEVEFGLKAAGLSRSEHSAALDEACGDVKNMRFHETVGILYKDGE